MIIGLALTLAATQSNATDYLLVLGDSFAQRNGLCTATDTRETCEAAGRINHDAEFTQYLFAYSRNTLAPIYNAGRGGDTCNGKGYYTTGIKAGQPIGLLPYLKASGISNPVNAVSVLIGYNDINGAMQATPEDTVDCIEGIWKDLEARGLSIIAMTYPLPTLVPYDAVRVENVKRLNGLIVERAAMFTKVSKVGFRLVRFDTGIKVKPVDIAEYDGLHPTQSMAKDMAKKIVGLLN